MLQRLNEQDFDAVWAIMEESFPVDERRPYEAQKALLTEKEYFKTLVVKGQGEIQSFMTVYELDSLVFLEHFAVSPKYRNWGLGAKMLAELLASADKPVCLEVELPDTDLALRRIGFYERNGFYLNEFPYIQPPLAEGQKEVPLCVMSSGRALNQAEFTKIKQEIYKIVYNTQ